MSPLLSSLLSIAIHSLSPNAAQGQPVTPPPKPQPSATQPSILPHNSPPTPSLPILTFAAYGDMPYRIPTPTGRTDEQILIQDIAPKIRQRHDIPFIIHVGDLGRPNDACSDEWLRTTQAFWQTELIKPVFYTPGDNDWTDCDRQTLNTPQSEIERLQAIRRFFFTPPKSVTPEWQLQEIQTLLISSPPGSTPSKRLQDIRKILTITPKIFAREWRYETQAQQPENAIWWRNGVLFVTQHIVGTNNGRSKILLDDPVQARTLVDERDTQNKIWLDRAFELAQAPTTLAIVVAIQADPFDSAIAQKKPLDRCLNNPAYQGFCNHLQTLAVSLNKPVLLLHGDTAPYCLDQPFDQTKNLWRLNAPGDFKVIDAAIISVFPSHPTAPFQAAGLLSEQPAPETCDATP